jgi:hypothetical protein
VYMLFDGVDEAFDSERQGFLSLAKDIQDAGEHSRIQLAIVGRTQLSDQILEALVVEVVPTIYVTSQKNSGDIEEYIKSSIRRSVKLKRASAQLREEIVEKLSSGAEGMFIWVDFMFKELLKKSNESSMRKSLDQAPKGLKEMLRHVLESFSAGSNEEEPEELEYLNELLAWTTCAPRPFKLGEIETILRLKSEDGNGLLWPENSLRKQFASFFAVNHEDKLTTAELQHPRHYKTDSDGSDDEADGGEAFEDVENNADFDSNKETTEVAFCHASIGNFFRDEAQGKVSASNGHIPVGVDFHEAKVHLLKTCLRLFCDSDFAKKAEATDFRSKYAGANWITHLQSLELPKAKLEDRREIARMLAQMFSEPEVIKLWIRSVAWHCSNNKLKLVRQWWEDKGVVDTLPEKEREFVTSTADAPASTFKLATMELATSWFDPLGLKPSYCAGIVLNYLRFEDGTNADSEVIN